ncbi:MAG: Fic family protein [Bacilli bacterium]|nr:Fic family protein [Bacilli bacterium]
MEIAKLLEEKSVIEASLEKMIYGSIEIREQNGKKLIYVHYRDNGRHYSKYVGEYSRDLFAMIATNNNTARAYKKRLREIKKELGKNNYIQEEISEDVAINIDLARRNLVDSVYKQAVLEGVATTYSDTETLVNGGMVNGMTAADVQKVVNLKRAWEFILSPGVILYPSNFAIVSQINGIVEEGLSFSAGRIRNVPVTIGGSSYVPPFPIEDQAKEDIRNITESDKSPLDKAIEALLYLKKRQLFLDGNKRTAVIFANHILIKNASGLIVIPSELVPEYKKLLIHYYETDEKEEIIRFLKEKCYRPLR